MFVVPVSVWAVLPAVQWCPPAADHLRVACFLGAGTPAEAAVLPTALASPARPSHLAAVHIAHARPTACSAMSARCAAAASCPYAACTNATPARATSREPVPALPLTHGHAPRGAPPSHHTRAFCLTDPNGGAGVRPHPPQLRTHTVLPAIAVAGDACSAPAESGHAPALQDDARPPSRNTEQHPPVRGPPGE